MNAKKITLSTISAALLCLASLSSHAATIFSQDFEAGLGANEATSGAFVQNTSGFGNNGTTMMGHAISYGNLNYAYYQISNLALTGSNRGDRHNRDILINSAFLGVEGTAEYLEELIQKKYGSGEE